MKTRVLLLLLLAVLCDPAPAQTSFPMIGSVFPVGVQRGKTTEITVIAGGNGGTNLNGAYKALFDGAGITAEVIAPEKGWPKPDTKTPWALPGVGEVKLRVTVAPDAPLGVREFRLATARAGISTLAQLVIDDEPQAIEQEPNNTSEQANAISFPCAVNGRFQQGEDVDNYRFKVEAGQTLVFAVRSARLQDKIHDLQEHADPMLTLLDMQGNTLAQADDYYRADPLLAHKFAKAGEYMLQIRDVGYKGNPHWMYLLTVTNRPYVTAVVPCAVRPGGSSELHLYGFNLGDAQTVKLDVPATTQPGLWSAQLALPGGPSQPVPLLVTDAPQTVTARPSAASRRTIPASVPGGNGEPLPIMPLVLPGGTNGVLAVERQIDRYKFRAKKGEGWGFEVTARRLESSIDSEIKIRNAKGDVLAANDDAFGKDSRLEWAAPEEGEYTIEVRDLAGNAGPTFFYNLTAQPLRPDFRLKCDTDRAMIAPGNRTTWYVLVERRHGFNSEIRVEVEGLPPGVTASPLVIPASMTTGTLFLAAAPDAKIDASRVRVIGMALLAGTDGKPQEAKRTACPITEIYMPGGGRGLLEVETQAVAVSEANDLEVSASTRQINLKPGETIKIEVEIKRRADYNKPVTLDVRVQHLGGVFVNPLPTGVTVDDGASKTLLGEGETKGYLTLRAAPDAAPVIDLPLAVFANASINFVMKVWYAAPPISLTVTNPAKK